MLTTEAHLAPVSPGSDVPVPERTSSVETVTSSLRDLLTDVVHARVALHRERPAHLLAADPDELLQGMFVDVPEAGGAVITRLG